jgi:alpha-D-ribose 1-methylphosphonate 5-phosphate C-P lyase
MFTDFGNATVQEEIAILPEVNKPHDNEFREYAVPPLAEVCSLQGRKKHDRARDFKNTCELVD